MQFTDNFPHCGEIRDDNKDNVGGNVAQTSGKHRRWFWSLWKICHLSPTNWKLCLTHTVKTQFNIRSRTCCLRPSGIVHTWQLSLQSDLPRVSTNAGYLRSVIIRHRPSFSASNSIPVSIIAAVCVWLPYNRFKLASWKKADLYMAHVSQYKCLCWPQQLTSAWRQRRRSAHTIRELLITSVR